MKAILGNLRQEMEHGLCISNKSGISGYLENPSRGGKVPSGSMPTNHRKNPPSTISKTLQTLAKAVNPR